MSSSLRSGEVSLRPLREEDMPFLLDMVGRPGVIEWWGTTDPPEREREGLLNDGAAWAIEVSGALAGWLGYNEETEPDYRFASLDITLAPEFHDHGYGRTALRLAAGWLIEERGHHRLAIDPDRANERAIRAYAAVGFRPVGVMRQANRNHAGVWTDALLMDLLADELAEDDGTAA